MTPLNSMPDLFFEALAEKVAQRLQYITGVRQRLFDLDRAAEYLGLSPEALRQKTHAGEVPQVGIDSRLRYDVHDLDKYIESHKH
jgi:hypothetical protein